MDLDHRRHRRPLLVSLNGTNADDEDDNDEDDDDDDDKEEDIESNNPIITDRSQLKEEVRRSTIVVMGKNNPRTRQRNFHSFESPQRGRGLAAAKSSSRVHPLLVLLALLSLVLAIYILSQLAGLNTYLSPIFEQPSSSRYPLPGPRLSQRSTNLTNFKKIILWTPFFGDWKFITNEKYAEFHCSAARERPCWWTNERTGLEHADAILFHIPDLARQFKNHNVHNEVHELDLLLPPKRFDNQSWAMLLHEAPSRETRSLLRLMDRSFNLTVTYRRDSDVVLSPTYRRKASAMAAAAAVSNSTVPSSSSSSSSRLKEIIRRKSKPVAWFASNCKTSSNRENYVARLKEVLPVDVYGSCGSLSCKPKMSQKCYTAAAETYWFYLAFENSICKDYITEKVYYALQYDWVPVVLGGSRSGSGGNYSPPALPPHSVINALDFESPDDLGKYLLSLIADPTNTTEYESYFAWKADYEEAPVEHYACQLCEVLHGRRQNSTADAATGAATRKTIPSLMHWWYDEAQCKRWRPDGLADIHRSIYR